MLIHYDSIFFRNYLRTRHLLVLFMPHDDYFSTLPNYDVYDVLGIYIHHDDYFSILILIDIYVMVF